MTNDDLLKIYTKKQAIFIRISIFIGVLSYPATFLILYCALRLGINLSLLYALIAVPVVLLVYFIIDFLFIKRNMKKHPEQFNKENIQKHYSEYLSHKSGYLVNKLKAKAKIADNNEGKEEKDK